MSCKGGVPELLIEVKLSDSNLSKNLKYFCSRYSVKGIQLVKNINKERSIGNLDIVSAADWLMSLFC